MAPRVPGLRRETTDLGTLLDKVIVQFQRQDAEIQFDGEPFAALLADGPFEIPVNVTDGIGVLAAFTKVNIVRVKITGGNAPGRELALGSTGGVPGPTNQEVDIGLIEGKGNALVKGTGVGTVILALEDVGASGLDTTNVATVTFS